MGQPLQYNLSICPPLLHGQSTYTVHQVRVSVSLRAVRHPLRTRAPISEPSTSASWVDKGDSRHGQSGRALTALQYHSFLSPHPVAKREGLFVSQWLFDQSDYLVRGVLRVGCCSFLNFSGRHWDARQSMLFTQDENYLSDVEGTDWVETWKPEQETSAQICLH